MIRRHVGVVALALTAALLLGGATSATATPATTNASAVQMSSVDGYLDAVYWDLFGRDVDPVGRGTWTAALASGTPRRAVADAITGSEEFRSGLIIDAYQTYLQRYPDAAGLQFWLSQMSAGMTIQQLRAGFIASDEYVARLDSQYGWPSVMAKEDWIDAVYEDVLGRGASHADLEFWLNHLDSVTVYCFDDCSDERVAALHAAKGPAMSRSEIALAFLMSTERLATDLDGDYQWLLERNLDPSGQATWIAQLQGGVRYEEVIGSIIASDEYWARATS